jgi:hypothetical protein
VLYRYHEEDSLAAARRSVRLVPHLSSLGYFRMGDELSLAGAGSISLGGTQMPVDLS